MTTGPDAKLREQGHEAFAQANFTLATQALERVVANDPSDAESIAMLGMIQSECGRHAPAGLRLQSACRLQPDNAAFRYQLGLALERAGDLSGATRAYSEAMRLDPALDPARIRLEAVRARQASTSGPGLPARKPSFRPPPFPRTGSYRLSPENRPGVPRAPNLHSDLLALDLSASQAFWRRFAARIIDSMLVGAAVSLLAFVAILGAIGINAGVLRSESASLIGGIILILFGYVLPPVLGAVYVVSMHTSRGQTLGQMVLGLRLMQADGSRPSVQTAILRDVVGLCLTALTFGVGDLWMLRDPAQQTLADKLAGTYVRRA